MSKRVPKFRVGQRVWKSEFGRERAMYVRRIEARSYIFANSPDKDDWMSRKRVSWDKAERTCDTDDRRAERKWLGDHHYRISEAVRGVRDIDKLKQIAAIVGYDPTPQGANP